jgi:hypothetical protein
LRPSAVVLAKASAEIAPALAASAVASVLEIAVFEDHLPLFWLKFLLLLHLYCWK